MRGSGHGYWNLLPAAPLTVVREASVHPDLAPPQDAAAVTMVYAAERSAAGAVA